MIVLPVRNPGENTARMKAGDNPVMKAITSSSRHTYGVYNFT